MNKNKKNDCVEMKDRIQQKLWLEYENNKDKFDSYADFINKTSEKNGEIRDFRKKHSQAYC